MEQKAKFWILVAVVLVLCSACSTDNSGSSQGQEDTPKPPPQVRVEILPSATAPPPLPTETVPPTVEVTNTVVFYAWPTQDIESRANEIEANIAEIERLLKSQNINIKP